MSAYNFTPGPWINDEGTISALVDPDNSAFYIAPICYLDPDWEAGIVQANAAAIAALPEVIAALVLAEDVLSRVAHEGAAMHLPTIRAALAKVRG